jgi:SAM-dependent methyltransferase
MNLPPVHTRIGALADGTRTRLLALLSRHELSVNELCAAVRLPQSTVSRHLKVLADDGWVATRAEGPSRYYRLARLDAPARRLWQVVRESVAESAEAGEDAARAVQLLADRRTRSQEFFSAAASEWEGLRAELFGAQAGLPGLLGLVPPEWTVADLGSGTGVVTAELAPHVSRVIAVDESRAMLAAARRRLGSAANVEFRAGSLESLPVAEGELDAAVMSLVLHYIVEPQQVLKETARALRPGGRLVVIDMMAHGRTELREQMGHVWQGFAEDQLRGWLAAAGYGSVRWHALPPATTARGPLLFVCSGTRQPNNGEDG